MLTRRVQSDSGAMPSVNSSYTSRASRIIFTKDYVRLFILQDSISNGRVVLFDSHRRSHTPHSTRRSQPPKQDPPNSTNQEHHTEKRFRTNSTKPFANSSASGVYTSSPPPSEERKHSASIDKQLLEMLFGSIPIADNITYKVHQLPQRSQIMLTCLFQYQYKPPDQETETIAPRHRLRSESAKGLSPVKSPAPELNSSDFNPAFTRRRSASERHESPPMFITQLRESMQSDKPAIDLTLININADQQLNSKQTDEEDKNVNTASKGESLGLSKTENVVDINYENLQELIEQQRAKKENNDEGVNDVATSKVEERASTTPSIAIDLHHEDLVTSVSPSTISPGHRRSISVGGSSTSQSMEEEKAKLEREKIKAASARRVSVSMNNIQQPRVYKSTMAIGVLVDTLPNSNAVQEMCGSHFVLIQYRLRLFAQILHETAQRIQKRLQKHAEEHFAGEKKDQDKDHQSIHSSHTSTRYRSLPSGFKFSDPFLGKYSLQTDVVLHSAVDDFQKCISSFMTYPRLQPPAWLDIVTFSESRKNTIHQLLQEVCFLVSMLETPGANYLLSTALTFVLAYHCSWVQTVTPAKSSHDHDSPFYPSHQPSPMINQLCQTFGCVQKSETRPGRICRVIVLGENKKLVCSLLFVLSFFIRSSSSVRQSFDLPISLEDAVSHVSEHFATGGNFSRPATSLRTSNSSIHGDDDRTTVEERILHLHVVDSVMFTPKKSNAANMSPYHCLGRSLFASYCNSYASDFVLMGMSLSSVHDNTNNHSITPLQTFEQLLARDLWAQCKFWPFQRQYEFEKRDNAINLFKHDITNEHNDNNAIRDKHKAGSSEGIVPPVLQSIPPPSQTSSRSFHLQSTSSVVIDTNENKCRVYCFEPHSSRHEKEQHQHQNLFKQQQSTHAPHLYTRHLERSTIIADTLKQVLRMHRSDIPAESCVLYLEDTLSRMFSLSELIKQFAIDENPSATVFSCSQLANLLHIPSRADVEMLATLQSNLSNSDSLMQLLDPA